MWNEKAFYDSLKKLSSKCQEYFNGERYEE